MKEIFQNVEDNEIEHEIIWAVVVSSKIIKC